MPGSLIDGRWELRAPIATGSSGEVVEAVDPASGERVAIKIMRSELMADPVAVERFEREATATGSIVHPNVVRVLNRGRHRGRPYLVMDLLVGETLEVRLQRGRMPRAEAVAVVQQLAAAVDAAHARGVIHRDLKPDNVFLLAGPKTAVRVLDFGYARLPEQMVGLVALTSPNALLGTPLYMAPEQIHATHGVDARADLWSLGVITYELLTGRPPFAAPTLADLFVQVLTAPIPTPRSIDPSLPPGIDRWCNRALARPKEQRFPDARSMADALTAVFRPAPRVPPWSLWIVLLLAALTLLAVSRMR